MKRVLNSSFRLFIMLTAVIQFSACPACQRDENDTLEWMLCECLNCSEAEEFLMCSDGLDNDEDGLTDCDDIDCLDIACCGKTGDETTDEACSDGCDNDGNGYIDCKDWNCTKYSPWVTACKSEQKEPEDNPAACSDGLDNDWNGYFDCDDFSCSKSDDVPFCEGNDITCSDGIDNDGDGYVDCKDWSCADAAVCQ